LGILSDGLEFDRIFSRPDWSFLEAPALRPGLLLRADQGTVPHIQPAPETCAGLDPSAVPDCVFCVWGYYRAVQGWSWTNLQSTLHPRHRSGVFFVLAVGLPHLVPFLF